MLPIILPPATLRPVAFRTLTKKFDLTLTSTALGSLAEFIGKHCGSEWREEGLAEKVLEEVAKSWKSISGAVILDGSSELFVHILATLEPRIRNGHFVPSAEAESHNEEAPAPQPLTEPSDPAKTAGTGNRSIGDEQNTSDLRRWLIIVDAFIQPRLRFDATKNQFVQMTKGPNALPEVASKLQLWHEEYALVYRRLLMHQISLQASHTEALPGASHSGVSREMTQKVTHEIMPIANMVGRTGSTHVIFGLLALSPAGVLMLSDTSGNVAVDINRAKAVPWNGTWFAPGMYAVVEGIYSEDETSIALIGKEGVGGTIRGKLVALSIGGPPCERREQSLGIERINEQSVNTWGKSGKGFGWVDFTGLGSERGSGRYMRALEKELLNSDPCQKRRAKIVVIGELNLENPKTVRALKKVIGRYSQSPVAAMPMAFILSGNFGQHAAMAGSDMSSRTVYKHLFESLASTLSEFPTVLRAARFIFVPGDQDPWASASSAGAAVPLPRRAVPEVFTAAIKKAFALANVEGETVPQTELGGDAAWTTNPARISFFGTAHEIVIFRDDLSARLRRLSIKFEADTETTGSSTALDDEGVIDTGTSQSQEVLEPREQRRRAESPKLSSLRHAKL